MSPADEDLVCPTCGQSPEDATTACVWRPAERPWWPWVMVAVGLYLVAVFGSRAWTAYQSLPSPREQSYCARAPGAGLGEAYECETAQWSEERFGRALLAVVIGAVTLLLGVGGIGTRELRESSNAHSALAGTTARRRARHGVVGAALATFTRAGALVLPCCQLLLAVTCFTLIVALVRGTPPSFDLVNTAIERTLDVAVAAIGLLVSALRLS